MLSEKRLFILFSIPIAILLLAIVSRLIFFQSPEKAAMEAAKEEANQKNIDIPYVSGDPVLGKKNASITLIVFGDFGCPSCAKMHETLLETLENFPNNIRIVWKGLPVTRYPVASDRAHAYAYCANKQNKFTALSKELFLHPESLQEADLVAAAQRAGLSEKQLASCLASTEPADHIDKTKNIADMLKLQTVPAIFLNNTPIPKNDFASASALEAYLGLHKE